MRAGAFMPAHCWRAAAAILALLTAVAYAATGAYAADRGLAPGATTSDYPSHPQMGARANALHSYNDDIDDVVTAPDIGVSNVITNDNLVLTIALRIRDRSSFTEGDGYSIYFDTDSNAATGTDALSGAPPGAEYSIDIARGKTYLVRWNGSSFALVTPRTPIVTAWLDGLGPVLQIGRTDIGDPQSFRFVFVTVNGDYDLAPDTGMWSYEVSPLVLTAGRIAVGRARAGKPLVASMSVERSDFEIPLSRGTIKCAARIGGNALDGRGTFLRERVSCTWRLPTNAAGKRLTGSVEVTFEGVTAKRAFSVRVR